MKRITKHEEIRTAIESEFDRTGGVFRLAPCWVGRPGIIVPGRRIKLLQEYISQEVAVNERWLASVTYADNGVYNKVCPEDHGLSYLVIGEMKVQLKDALAVCGELLLGRNKRWDVLPKFFDNWGRIPHHLHPCDDHVRQGLIGKPESYHFPLELNVNRNAYPRTPIGVDPGVSDASFLRALRQYFKGDNHLTDHANTINLVPGTGWFMPPCTLHGPGSLATYELQVASDVTCIPESRLDDTVMPPDSFGSGPSGHREERRRGSGLCPHPEDDQLSAVGQSRKLSPAILSSAGRHSPGKRLPPGLRHLSLRARLGAGEPGPVQRQAHGGRRQAILGAGRRGAFGVVVLSGHGTVEVPGKAPVEIESASLFYDREELGADEIFVSAPAAARLNVRCASTSGSVFISISRREPILIRKRTAGIMTGYGLGKSGLERAGTAFLIASRESW